MQFLIQLPPASDRRELIGLWIDSMLSEHQDYRLFREKVSELIDQGYSQHGLSVFLLHDDTQEYIADKVGRHRDSVNMSAVMEFPISLN